MKELLEHVLIQLEPCTSESTGESNVGIADHRPSLHWQIVNHDTDVFDVNAAYGLSISIPAGWRVGRAIRNPVPSHLQNCTNLINPVSTMVQRWIGT